jgi:hypothetical protein
MENAPLWRSVGEYLTPILSTVPDDFIDKVSKAIIDIIEEPKCYRDQRLTFVIDKPNEGLFIDGVSFWENSLEKDGEYAPGVMTSRLVSIVFDCIMFDNIDLNPMQILLVESKIEKTYPQ